MWGEMGWGMCVDCVQDKIQDATLRDACTHDIGRRHGVGLGYLIVSIGQDVVIGGREDALELGQQALIPHSM